MPRGVYTGTSKYAVFWGGDVGGPQEGFAASIIALQRSAVMGYPNWGADTCGYGKSPMEQEVCARWLAFSCFNPIMEVGPTRNVAFWNLLREPKMTPRSSRRGGFTRDCISGSWITATRMARKRRETGFPIARPLFLG